MADSLTALRKRVKELRGVVIAGSISSAGVEELKKEIAYHESAVKSAERDKKRMEALAKARESKIAKGKAKKEAAEPVKEKVVKAKKEAAEPVAKKPKVEAVKPVKEKPVKEKVKEEVEVVLAKNIRAKKVKDAEPDDE